jgi:hypothetical protein
VFWLDGRTEDSPQIEHYEVCKHDPGRTDCKEQ